MKVRSRSLIAVVLVMCLLIAGSSVSAAQPRWIGTTDIQINLEISSTGLTECYTQIGMLPGYTANATMKLQRSTNQVLWDTVKTWSASGCSYVEWTRNYYVAEGYCYRVAVTADIYNAAGTFIETVSGYSPKVFY